MVQKNTKIIAVSGVSFFIISMLIFGAFFSIVQKHKQDFFGQKMVSAEQESHRRALMSLMRTLEDTTTERATLASRILPDEGVINFLALIESLGIEQGISLKTNSLTVEPVDDIFETLVVSITVEGSYEGVMHILQLLENLPYQSFVTKISFTKTEGEFWQSVYDVRVTKFKKP